MLSQTFRHTQWQANPESSSLLGAHQVIQVVFTARPPPFLYKPTGKLPRGLLQAPLPEVTLRAQHKFRPRHTDETVLMAAMNWFLPQEVGGRHLFSFSLKSLHGKALGPGIPLPSTQELAGKLLRGFECCLEGDIYVSVMGLVPPPCSCHPAGQWPAVCWQTPGASHVEATCKWSAQAATWAFLDVLLKLSSHLPGFE